MNIPATRHSFRQRGVAALTAILVVAMATILAVELAWELNLDIRRTENLLLRTQARQFAIGAEVLAADALKTDYEDDIGEGDAPCDHLDEGWSTELALPFEGGTVRGRLTDLQGRFNLNDIASASGKNEVAFDQFVRLLEVLELDPGLATKILDWIDVDQVAELGGGEDDAYTGRQPPYRTANTWFTTTTELLAIDGFIDPANPSDQLFRKLERYVSALPTGQAINVNTAEDAVLLSMASAPRGAAAEDLRVNRPYCKILASAAGEKVSFKDDAVDIVEAKLFTSARLVPTSNYFQLKVLVTIGNAKLTMYSVLHRDANGFVTTSLRYFDTK